MREAELAAIHVVLLQALEEAGDVQAQAAHDLPHKLVADAGDVRGLLHLRAQLRLGDSQLELGVLPWLAADLERDRSSVRSTPVRMHYLSVMHWTGKS